MYKRQGYFFANPYSHSVTGGRGGGRTVPVGGLFTAGKWSGTALVALQQLDRAGPSWNLPISEQTASNSYVEASLARRLSGGLSLGAAYYYFPSKEALMFAYYEDNQAEFERIAAAATGTVRARLGALLHGKLASIRPHRAMLASILARLMDPGDPLSAFSAQTASARAWQALAVHQVRWCGGALIRKLGISVSGEGCSGAQMISVPPGRSRATSWRVKPSGSATCSIT